MNHGWKLRVLASPAKSLLSRRVAVFAIAAAVTIAVPNVLAAAEPEQAGTGRTPTAAHNAMPPASPARYRLPAKAIWVSTSSQLRRALARGSHRDIVLRDGIYDSDAPFYDRRGNRLWAQTVGGAVLRAGLAIGSTAGPGSAGLVQGLAFDVSDPAKTLENSVMHVWGSATGTRILDVTIDGNGTVDAGIAARQVDGLVIRRVDAHNFRSFGVIVDANRPDHAVAHPPVLTDITAAYVGWSPPQSSRGTAEACVWIGNTSVVRRIEVHDCAWEGLWVGTAATNALFEDVRVWNEGTGVYLEHFVRSSIFRRLQAGPNVTRGLTCEWADPGWGSQPACVGNVIDESFFDTDAIGVYLDEGTVGTTVRNSVFAGQCWAAIVNYKGVNNLYDTTGNDYSRLRAGAVPVSNDHDRLLPNCRGAALG